MDTSYVEIVKVLQDYFHDFYSSDMEKLKRVFHPNCHLMSATVGPLADDDSRPHQRPEWRQDGVPCPLSFGKETNDDDRGNPC